ncbi:MAG: hypothetical protein ABFS46_20135, partial [Myxococcota bacterium]
MRVDIQAHIGVLGQDRVDAAFETRRRFASVRSTGSIVRRSAALAVSAVPESGSASLEARPSLLDEGAL